MPVCYSCQRRTIQLLIKPASIIIICFFHFLVQPHDPTHTRIQIGKIIGSGEYRAHTLHGLACFIQTSSLMAKKAAIFFQTSWFGLHKNTDRAPPIDVLKSLSHIWLISLVDHTVGDGNFNAFIIKSVLNSAEHFTLKSPLFSWKGFE